MAEVLHAFFYSPAINAGRLPAPWGAAMLTAALMFLVGWAIGKLIQGIIRLRCKHPSQTYYRGIDASSAWWFCSKCGRYFRGREIEVPLDENPEAPSPEAGASA